MRWIPSQASERRPPHSVPHRGDEGSEVVSHLFVQALVLVVILAVLQLGFALHTRNLAIAAAGEGARRGALLGASEQEAVRRTDVVFDALVGPSRPRSISVSRSGGPGGGVFTVSLTTTVPIVGPLGPQWLTVTGSSIVEEEP